MGTALTKEQTEHRTKMYYELKGRGYSNTKIAGELGIAEATFRNWRNRHGINKVQETLSKNSMPTHYDRAWMRLKDTEGNKMTVAVKGGQLDMMQGIKDFLEEVKFEPPVFPKIKRTKSKRTNFAVLDPADIHLQKLSCEDYTHSVDKYIKELNQGCDNLLGLIEDEGVDRIVLVIGNDVLHVDSEQNTTTRGTRQDSSELWNQAYTMAFDWYKDVILKCMNVADVHVIFNKSNHDKHLGFTLAHCLGKYFEKSKNITFDCSFKDCKAFFHGGAALAFSHGDNGKPKDYANRLPFILKGGFDNAKSYHFYLHHRHHAEQFSIKDFGQVTVETVRSPSVPDQWHEDKGYDSLRVMSAFIHDKDTGFQTKRLNHLF